MCCCGIRRERCKKINRKIMCTCEHVCLCALFQQILITLPIIWVQTKLQDLVIIWLSVFLQLQITPTPVCVCYFLKGTVVTANSLPTLAYRNQPYAFLHCTTSSLLCKHPGLSSTSKSGQLHLPLMAGFMHHYGLA